MNWLAFALATIVLYSLMDFFILGIIFLREGVNPKYAAGFLLSLVGLYLLITAR